MHTNHKVICSNRKFISAIVIFPEAIHFILKAIIYPSPGFDLSSIVIGYLLQTSCRSQRYRQAINIYGPNTDTAVPLAYQTPHQQAVEAIKYGIL